MDITSLTIFVCFKYIWLILNLMPSIIFKILTNHEKFECMEYICDKIIHVMEFEKIAYILQN
jgi:hypothetical protein